MKVGFIQCAIISAVFAIAGYLVFSTAALSASLPVSVSAALLISGMLTPWLASLLNSTPTKQASSSPSDADVTTLYVGNLPYKANEDAVKEYFSRFLPVQSVRLMKDRRTGKRKGYGFIEVVTDDIDQTIQKLNDTTFQERTLKVRPAKDKADE
ncbi:RNA-binding protein [Alteromonas sp. ASW11-19]|uniref:RNA-binding protein n=1 Tax=Alteromonas salexigens TaxID=2982530 RepID=A0ABT2VJ08_9ALTE|nr:RNA-binding protein [Alteromonas salexigens]MCU7553180.1 RNA-binding protein [Alteromonas salexigens]